jgi:hypothetical protein
MESDELMELMEFIVSVHVVERTARWEMVVESDVVHYVNVDVLCGDADTHNCRGDSDGGLITSGADGC